MMEHGGVYHHYYSSRKTTHIIASNLPDVKVRQLKGHELILKVSYILYSATIFFVDKT
jgi:DNA repair protein REV1